MTGLWATFLGVVSERTRASSNRAWSRVDRPARHGWTGTDEQLQILQKVYAHRLRKIGAGR
ncbi:hypothetical protein GCM10009836_68830 [Pseudonocardia ailaonensis]|uniref:Transposase n=1 Tax=Pseudonocardia ailaonensis TaxID=367279 RepID=A0ABN2NNT3_9PSEU